MKRRTMTMCMVFAVAACAAASWAQVSQQGRVQMRQALAADPQLEYSPTTIFVRFNEAFPAHNRAAARAMAGGRLAHAFAGIDGLELVEVSIPVEQALNALRAMPFVEYAEPDYTIELFSTPNDPDYHLLWGMQSIDAEQGWAVSTGSGNFVIAVIDSGIQYNHPDLALNVWMNPCEALNVWMNPCEALDGTDTCGNGYVDDIMGWNFFDDNNDPWDTHSASHGTHVSGTVGAVGDNGIGVVGVNWNVQIMPLKLGGTDHTAFASMAVLALEYAVNNGAMVSNNSWGVNVNMSSLREMIEWAGSQGHLFVCAAGNNNRNLDDHRGGAASVLNLPAVVEPAQHAYGCGDRRE